MDVLLVVIAAIVGINAVVIAVLVARFRAEQRDDGDDQLERIAEMWDARRDGGHDHGAASAA